MTEGANATIGDRRTSHSASAPRRISGPLVSVIVPTRNSEKNIGKCLSSVLQQTYPNVEMTVVDQMSEDRTKLIASCFGATLLSIPYGGAYLPPTKSRNFGASASSGDYLLHIDADMELSSRVVESCLELSAAGAQAVLIPETDAFATFWGRCKALERSCYLGDPVFENPRFFSRDAFNKIGGYDENLNAGEDWDVHIRLRVGGFSVARSDEYLTHHIEDFDFLKNLKKKHVYAQSLGAFRDKHPEESRQTLTLMRPAFWRNMRKLAMEPMHAGGLATQKLFEAYCSWIGIHGTGHRSSRPKRDRILGATE